MKEDCRSDNCPVTVKVTVARASVSKFLKLLLCNYTHTQDMADGVDYTSKFTRADLESAKTVIDRMAAPVRVATH